MRENRESEYAVTSIRGTKFHFDIGELVAETPAFRLYVCRQEGVVRECLMQVATDVTQGALLDRVVFILQELDRRAVELEAEYATVKVDKQDMLNYQLGFPELVDSFVLPCDQGGRRANMLAFRNVDAAYDMKPLNKIIEVNKRRVDKRTSAWIMGKLLKLLVFSHSTGISIVRMDTSNVLIEPEKHYVLLFDWSEAVFHTGAVPNVTQRDEISRAARAVIELLGGDALTCVFPQNEGEEDQAEYTDQLVALARGSECDTQTAHAQFYELVRGLWRGFHPFTSYRR